MKGQTNRAILDNKLQRGLRKNMTDAEMALWHSINRDQIEGFKFRRQHPFLDYVLDFVCLERRLVVEVDGGQHLAAASDVQRDKRLNKAGFRVLRFWNNDVLVNQAAVLEMIRDALLAEPHPYPNPPLEGEGVHPIPTPTVSLKGRKCIPSLPGSLLEGKEALATCCSQAGER